MSKIYSPTAGYSSRANPSHGHEKSTVNNAHSNGYPHSIVDCWLVGQTNIVKDRFLKMYTIQGK